MVATTVEVSFDITPETMPTGTHWGGDGDAWRAVKTTAGVDDYRDWWRWAPINASAIAKGSPDTPLYDFYPYRHAHPK